MNIDLLYAVLPEDCSAGVGTIWRLLWSMKNLFITSSMPRRFTGSASGVMMVAKCSDASVTPGTRRRSRPFR